MRSQVLYQAAQVDSTELPVIFFTTCWVLKGSSSSAYVPGYTALLTYMLILQTAGNNQARLLCLVKRTGIPTTALAGATSDN